MPITNGLYIPTDFGNQGINFLYQFVEKLVLYPGGVRHSPNDTIEQAKFALEEFDRYVKPGVTIPPQYHEVMLRLLQRAASEVFYREAADGEDLDELSAIHDKAQELCDELGIEYELLDDDEETEDDDPENL